MALTPLPEALSYLLTRVPSPPDAIALPLEQCCNRVLAQSVTASVDVPGFDNSAMDGYAIRAADLPGELPVTQRIPAGVAPKPLMSGTAARIFTGAPIPLGADTVVMQEDAVAQGSGVAILGCPTVGAHIRRRGCDIAAGTLVLSAGQVLTPQAIGLAASVGCSHLPVYRALRVAVVTTGDELVQPGHVLAPGQIYNSNGVQVQAQLQLLGMEVVLVDSLPDDPDTIGSTLDRLADETDCVITCGGVSVGEEDHVRAQILARGQLDLWKLAIKPGKPLAFGTIRQTPVFGLPGNPVSAWATFALVVKPWLMRAQGAELVPPRRYPVIADFDIARPGTREEYLRVELHENVGAANGRGERWIARLAGDQSSGVLSTVSRCDGLAIIPIGQTVSVGDVVDVLLMPSLLHPSAG